MPDSTQAGLDPSPVDRPWSDLATAEDIYHCFRLILGRAPHPPEMKGHFSRVGEDLTGVVRSYVGALEFAKRGLLTGTVPDHVELITLDDFSIYISGEDSAVGKHIRSGGYEPEVARIFCRFLTPGMTVLDVGANIGFFTMLAASVVGPAGRVVAVEPNVQNIRLLEASRRANGFEQVVVAHAAAGTGVGLLALNTSYSNGTPSAIDHDLGALMSAQIVPCFPLPAMVPAGRRVDFIKIDIEGAEYLALLGAQEMLRKDRPVIVSEFSPDLMPVFPASAEMTICRF